MRLLFLSFGFLFAFSVSLTSYAWGERGHHSICFVATRLVKDPELKGFLSPRGNVMAHLCNIPDINWRSLGEKAKSGDAAHYVDPEIFGFEISTMPTKVVDLMAQIQAKNSEKTMKASEVLSKLGSNWWRANQFYEMALLHAEEAQKAPLPSDSKQESDDEFPYNKEIFLMMSNLGFMGHFIGDASMPYHNTANYDGWKNGHGGIHKFYETECVDYYPLSLEQDIFKQTKLKSNEKLFKNFAASDLSVTERMKAISQSAIDDMPKVEKLDKLLKASVEGDSKKRELAQRDSLDKACPKFYPLFLNQMARSSVLLAQFWDEIYAKAKKPHLKNYKSFRYPLNPDFIPLDYDK